MQTDANMSQLNISRTQTHVQGPCLSRSNAGAARCASASPEAAQKAPGDGKPEGNSDHDSCNAGDNANDRLSTCRRKTS